MVDILGIGASGLTAYRKLLETVGGNITNASTDGYVRRDVMLSGSGDSTMLPTSAASTSGSGVMVDMVRRASDAFLQTQALRANALNLQSQTLADSLTNLEKSLFGSSSNAGTVVQDFFSRFNDVANAPTSAAARISVVDSGKQVVRTFVQTAASVQDSLQSARAGLDAALASVNAITSQLGRLNVQIQSASSSGQKPNDLLDQRDKLLTSLSQLANFTYTEQTSGAITLYLGDTASGRPLVSLDGAHTLGAIEADGKLEIAMDPYSQPAPTNQLTSGTVAGLMDFRTQAMSLLSDLNRLAVGFAVAVNDQHRQGVDLNGSQGGAMFSTDGLTAVGAKTNLGDAKLLLSVNSAASLGDATYAVRYNQGADAWTIKSSNGATVTGANHLSLDGVTFNFDGQARDGDSFTISPLIGAASSMRFLVQTPDEIAVALPLYVDPSPANAGTAELRPLQRTGKDQPAPLPSAQSLFDSVNAVTDFKRNGSAFILPTGATGATLNSLGMLSAVHFTASASDISALAQPDANGIAGLTLSLYLDGNAQPALLLNPKGSSLTDVAGAINTAAEQAGQRDSYFASVTNGTLSINALNGHAVSQARISGVTSAGDAAQVFGVNEPGATAADIQIFTREGRQLSGTPLTDIQARNLITTANGFLPEAIYAPPSQTAGYPRVIQETSAPLLKTQGDDSSAAIDVSVQAAFNMSQAGYGQKPLAGAVYALNVDGLSPIRLGGDSLSGADPAAVAAGMADQMNAQAARHSWLGANINFTDNMPQTIAFNVSIDGKDHAVVFHRAETANGSLLPTGTFDLGGATDLQVSLVVDGSYDSTRLTLPLNPGSAAGQSIELMNGSQLLVRKTLTALDVASGSVSLDRPVMSAAEIAQLTATQTANGVSTTLAGAIAVSSVSNPGGSRVMVAIPPRLRTQSPTISITPGVNTTPSGLTALGLTDGKPFTATVSSASDLTTSLLAARQPALRVTGAQIGVQDLTINGPNGSSNGVSWTTVEGKLQLSSADATMRIDASGSYMALATALGFTGLEPAARKISAAQDTASSLLAAQSAQITIATPTGDTPTLLAARKPTIQMAGATGSHLITIGGASGTSNGVSWALVDGKLQLTSTDATMHIDTSTPAYMQLAQALGFTGQEPSARQITAAQAADVSLNTYTLSIGAPSGSDADSGVSWRLNNGKLTFASGDTSLQFKAQTSAERAGASSLGFKGSDLDLSVESTIAGADELTLSLLAGRKPTLQVVGDKIGHQVLTVSSPSGTFNGVSWSLVNGKLKLSSSDPTMRIDAGTGATLAMANALGFTGAEQGGPNISATQEAAGGLLASKGVELAVSGETGDKTVIINSLAGSDAQSGVSWSYDGKKLTLSSPHANFGVKVSTIDTRNAAQLLGFRGAGLDMLMENARLKLSSTATDRTAALADTSATTSRVGKSIQFSNGVPEDLIVALTNPDAYGLRRVAASVEMDPAPPPAPKMDLVVKILDSGKLKIFDPATGLSLANRSWEQDSPVTYQGMSFTIHGSAKPGDLFSIKNDGARTSDNRNALRMAELALVSIFGKGQGSFQDVYASVTAKLGTAVESANMQATAAQQAASDLKGAYEAKTGVNLDREASDLIRFQQAYQAAAQVVMAAREMFATILKSF